jgi:hypothetical protein
LAFHCWIPTWNFAADYYGKLHQAWLTLSDQCQLFAGRRITEELRVLHRLASAKNAEELWGLYGGFWQSAIDDYWKECGSLAKLASGFMASAVPAAQTAPEDVLNAPESKAA